MIGTDIANGNKLSPYLGFGGPNRCFFSQKRAKASYNFYSEYVCVYSYTHRTTRTTELVVTESVVY